MWGDASSGDLRPAGRGDHGEALLAWAGRAVGPDRLAQVRWMEQLHGSTVLVAGLPVGGVGGARGAGGGGEAPSPVRRGARVACAGPGDALASAAPELALAVLTADCASIALGSAEGVFAAVHAGWRGLLAGVVDHAVGTLRDLGAVEVVGALGPCIHAECYQFSEDDLASVVAAWGEAARGTTSAGRPALDLPAAVASALAAAGARQVPGLDACTACDPGYFSHRARQDRGRQALVVWSDPAAPR